jgi:hypothetical protein
MRWTRQRRAREAFAGREFRERAAARRRPALKRFGQNLFRRHTGRSGRMARGSRGRPRRVVPAPVAGVKPAEMRAIQPDRRHRQFAGDGGKTNSSPGRARYTPLKPLRREGRVFRRACGLPCARCAHDCGCLRAPGFPCALLDFGGQRRMQIPGRAALRDVSVRVAPTLSCPAHAGHPVRRGLPVKALTSLEYWIARSSRAMTAKDSRAV